MPNRVTIREPIPSPIESFGKVFLEIFKSAVGNQDPARDSLLFVPINSLNLALLDEDVTRAKRSIEETDVQLGSMLRLILEHNDFQLYRSTIHFLSVSLVATDLAQLGYDLDSMILSNLGLALPQNRKLIESLRFVLHFESGIRFERVFEMYQSFAHSLEVSGEKDKQNVLREFREEAIAFYTNSLLLRLFFLASVNVLFRYREQEYLFDATSYLTELWHHTRPEDADATILNVTPVFTDPLRLTMLYLYGGAGNRLWEEIYGFRDFHGIKKYAVQSYLLGLAKIGKSIAAPTHSQLKTLAENALWDELGELYRLADDFLNEMKNDMFQHQLTEITKLQLDSFIDRNREIKDGRSWHDQLMQVINEAQTSFLDAKQMIEGYLPVDDKKVADCIANINTSYQKYSLVERAATPFACRTQEECESLRVLGGNFVVPKDCFVRPSNVIVLWDDYGRRVAELERSHIAATLSGITPSRVVEEYDPDRICDVIIETARNQSAPNLVFMPLDLLTEWEKRLRVEYTPNPTLSLSNAKLELVYVLKDSSFQDIAILDKLKCQWLYEDFHGSRLEVHVELSSHESNKVSIDIRNRGLFVPRDGGVQVVKLPTRPPELEQAETAKESSPVSS